MSSGLGITINSKNPSININYFVGSSRVMSPHQEQEEFYQFYKDFCDSQSHGRPIEEFFAKKVLEDHENLRHVPENLHMKVVQCMGKILKQKEEEALLRQQNQRYYNSMQGQGHHEHPHTYQPYPPVSDNVGDGQHAHQKHHHRHVKQAHQ